MILYLDTSALVKLYVNEDGHHQVKRAVDRASYVATSRVAYAEARSALSRLRREGVMGAKRLRGAVEALKRDLSSLIQVELTSRVSLQAGELAEAHGLRGFDAIHLASAMELGQPPGPGVELMTFDSRQKRAAKKESVPLAM